MRIERILNYILLIGLIMVLMFALVNGQDEGVVEGTDLPLPYKEMIGVTDLPEEIEVPVEATPAPIITNLDVFFIDKINGSAIKLTNCAVVVMGKMKVAEDSFDYNNTFLEGDRYEMTIMIEPKQ